MSGPAMALEPAMLQLAAIAVGHVALALLVGAVVTSRLGPPVAVGSADVVGRGLRRVFAGAAVVAATAQGAQLWALAAVMGDVALGDAGPQLVPVSTGTHAGRMGLLGLAAIGVVLAASWLAARARDDGAARSAMRVAQAGLVLLLVARAAGGHAAADGGAGAVVLLLAHVAAGCAWAGVVVSASIVASAWLAAPPEASIEALGYVRRLSAFATLVLALVAASGVALAWRVVSASTWAEALASGWGRALLVKLALVAVASVLGGFNRVVGLPAIARATAAGEGASGAAWRRLRRVLVVEAAVLGLVLACAAWLATSAPPG